MRSGLLVLIVDLHPVHPAAFVASLGREVDEVVRTDQQVQAALVGRIRPEDLSLVVLVELAQTGLLFAPLRLHFEVVEYVALLEILRFERDTEIVVERRAVRSEPPDGPSHPLLEFRETAERRP